PCPNAHGSHAAKPLETFEISLINWKSVNRLQSRPVDGDLVLAGQVQRASRLLVEHVLLDGAVVQKLHALFEFLTLGLDSRKLTLQRFDLGIELVLVIDAEFAVEGMEAEIGQERHGDGGDDEHARPPLAVLACPRSASAKPHVGEILFAPEYGPIMLNGGLRSARPMWCFVRYPRGRKALSPA